MSDSLPIIDISPLVKLGEDRTVARQINQACTQNGFFYISGHGISELLQSRLEEMSRRFFSQTEEVKMRIRMSLGGLAWRGYFPLKGELTSGRPDLKEGLYFGAELDSGHPSVRKGWPMHGKNLFPEQFPEMRDVVLSYIAELTNLGHTLMRGISMSLDLPPDYFYQKFTYDPLVLFRIFHYPGMQGNKEQDNLWGVGAHTDYGVLTILKQDSIGGLQVKSKNSGWIEAPYIPGSFICNIGDMLDKMTGGYYKSTPHRVKNSTNRSRYSYPFFFDPNFKATIESIPLKGKEGDKRGEDSRWDHADVHNFEGTYDKYVFSKVSKVFPGMMENL